MSKRSIIIASGVVSLLIVGGALAAVMMRPKPEATTSGQRQVSKSELAKADGKDGRDCLVAVDGFVYQIKDFSLWQNGEHTTSNGQAYCGADMTEAIGKSPHGRKVLDLLIKVGPLQT